MKISLAYLIAHCLCSVILAVSAWALKINKRWIFLFTFLFFICRTRCIFGLGAVSFLWLIRGGILCFFCFGQGQQSGFTFFLRPRKASCDTFFGPRCLFFARALFLTSFSEIDLRRDALTFWTYEVQKPSDCRGPE